MKRGDTLPTTRLKIAARLKYGDSLSLDKRIEIGTVPVFGSNGQVGTHNSPNTHGPVIIIGRKGSFGSIRWSEQPTFCIDTTYFVDDTACRQNLRWLFYAMQSLNLGAISQDTGVPGLSREDAYERLLWIPDPGTQKNLADFLDRETAKADPLVAKYERLIELLEEKRVALITEAVTKGLDLNVPMKDSGVEWIGQIPEHWDIGRLKTSASLRYGLGQPPAEMSKGLPFVRATNVDAGRILDKGMLYVDPAAVPKSRNAFLKEGDIIVVRSGALTGDSAIIPKQFAGAVAGYDIVISAPDKDTAGFLSWCLLSGHVSYQISIARLRAAQPHINTAEVGSLILTLPPIEERGRIADYLAKQAKSIDALVTKTRQALGLVKERRSALITAAVTGQIDVRTYEAKEMEIA